MTISLGVLMPLPLNGKGVGYSCSSIAAGMAGSDFRISIVTPRCKEKLSSVEVLETLPSWTSPIPYRWLRKKAACEIEAAFLSQMKHITAPPIGAYLWPDASLATIEELRRRGIMIFREQFNCHTATAKRLLDNAYFRLGIRPQHGITDVHIEGERRVSSLADYIISPSPLVSSSLLENGIPASKQLAATYGWDPERMSRAGKELPPCDGITAIFVGAICVRKGAHLLLDMWARSGIKGRLVLVGEMEPAISETCAHILARDDVLTFDYMKNIGGLYRSADVFLFPTLEEGSPLVIYEACGAELPVITTAMGGGHVIRDGREGYIRDAYDRDGWIDTLRELANDPDLRQRMAIAAADRAQQFTWPLVAERRRKAMMACFGHDG